MASGRPESDEKQPTRRRLWFNDESSIRLRPERKDHVWSYDFVADRKSNGKPLRRLNVIDEYARECLAIKIDRKITSSDVVEALAQLFVTEELLLTYDRIMDLSLLLIQSNHGWQYSA